MKFIHLSDLHIGKRIGEFPMDDEQRYILSEILGITEKEKPDCVIIAGDVYDRTIPSTEAVKIFDDFLVSLAEKNTEVFIISGNHDSPERLSFGGRLMDSKGVHISKVYDGNVAPFRVKDGYGEVNIYLLPFVKPVNVRQIFKEEEILTYTDAVRTAVEHMNIDLSARNILVTHQFVTGALRSESEDISVGGTDNVDTSVFDGIDYVALGHLHRPQNVISERIRYCGTPLKYSFSESRDIKSLTIGELREKGDLRIRTCPLVPEHDMVELRGSFEELRNVCEKKSYQNDYIHITLTDEEEIPDAVSRLRSTYMNILKLDYDNARTRSSFVISEAPDSKINDPAQMFAELFELQNGRAMSDEQAELIKEMIEKIWEEEE